MTLLRMCKDCLNAELLVRSYIIEIGDLRQLVREKDMGLIFVSGVSLVLAYAYFKFAYDSLPRV